MPKLNTVIDEQFVFISKQYFSLQTESLVHHIYTILPVGSEDRAPGPDQRPRSKGRRLSKSQKTRGEVDGKFGVPDIHGQKVGP